MQPMEVMSTPTVGIKVGGVIHWVNAVAWSPDGQRIASGSNDKTVQVWNATDGGQVYTYKGHSGGVYARSVVTGWEAHCLWLQ